MNNLPTYVALEKLTSSVKHGRVVLEYQVRNGEIVGIIATGKKKMQFNSSEKDININQVAMEAIVKRINHQLDMKVSSELVFRVSNNLDKIKYIEVESKQIIK